MKINFASIYYPFLGKLLEGKYTSEGITYFWHYVFPPFKLFRQIIESKSYELSEMSLSTYTMLRQQGWDNYIALPIFTSRCFRHSSLFVRSKSRITDGAGLKGKRVGVPEYHMTAAVWVRGFLWDDFGVDPGEVTWFTGGLERPGRRERVKLPDRISAKIIPIKSGETLFNMLLQGRLDAVLSPYIPAPLRNNLWPVRRLFINSAEVEMDYYRDHKIFPIMHTVVLRHDLYKKNPVVALKVYRALKKLKEDFYSKVKLLDSTFSLPWFYKYLGEVMEVLGDDPWPYGLSRNSKTLNKYFGYAFQQGLIDKKPKLKDLFVDLNG